jgi:hypothetical protein
VLPWRRDPVRNDRLFSGLPWRRCPPGAVIAAPADASALVSPKNLVPPAPTAGTRLAMLWVMSSTACFVSGASLMIHSPALSEAVSETLVPPETLLPVQFANRDTSRAEKRLMAAVLEEAVATFQRNLHAKTRRGQRLFREVDEWIRSADTSWTFAFESVCHTLGLDPEYLRAGLERLRQHRPAGGPRLYRFRRVSGDRTAVVPTRARLDEGGARKHAS